MSAVSYGRVVFTRYEQLLPPLVDLAMDVAIGIQTDLVTGIRFGKAE